MNSKARTLHQIQSISRLTTATLLPFLTLISKANAGLGPIPPFPSKGFQTKSGLRFFDFQEGTVGGTPRYGQLVSFFYTGYYRAGTTGPLQVFDSSYLNYGKEPFLHKHGTLVYKSLSASFLYTAC